MRVSEFMSAWHAAGLESDGLKTGGDANPIAAYRLPSGEIAWHISTRPQEAHSSAQSHLSLAYDIDHVDVVLDAHISTALGYLFQYQLTGPKDLRIDDVSLLEEDINRVSRWSQDAAGHITVFLNGAVSGEQRFVLRGRLPTALGQTVPLPCLRLEHCQLGPTTIRIFRDPMVLVTIQGDKHTAAAVPMPNEMADSALGQFVDAFSYDGPQPPAIKMTTSLRPDPPPTPR